MFFRFIILLSFIALVTAIAHAQPSFEYKALQDDSAELVTLKNETRKQFVKDSLLINGENKKYILAIYKERFHDINELFHNKEAITDAAANAYLTGISNEILYKNPELKKLAPRIIFSRAYWPNAYSTGEGTIVFNIDLFVRLQNESQVAFVLCHELAHLYLDHSNKKINRYISTLYSEEVQQKLKELKKKTYDKKEELDKLEMGFAFNSFRHSRDSESEADSTALRFMKNTGYDCREALSCLALLDKIDEEQIDFTQELPAVFSFPAYPFRKRWIEKQAAFFGVTADTKEKKAIEDSLKTHPDCKIRINTLSPLFEQLQIAGGQQFLQNQQQFNLLQQQFAFEVATYCFNTKKISKCLFNTLCLLKRYPGNVYLVTLAGRCLNELYAKQQVHELNKIAELPSPYKEKNYNTLLEFIGRLSLTELSSLAYHFMNQYSSSFSTHADFSKVFEQCRKNYHEMVKQD
jgi:Zn-dependent protease with chaperone function